VRISVRGLRGAFGDPVGQRLLIVASRATLEQLDLVNDGGYSCVTGMAADAEEIPTLLDALDGPCHIFVITTDSTFQSPPASAVAKAKLGVLPLYSTGFSWAKLRAALSIIGGTDFADQHRRARKVVAALDEGETVTFLGSASTSLQLRTWAGRQLHFFDQSGPIGWGRQSVLPGGELSLLTDGHGQYSADANFLLDGDLVVATAPVVHRGGCPCAIARLRLEGDTRAAGACTMRDRVTDARLRDVFSALEHAARRPALLHIRGGFIEQAASLGVQSPFVAALDALFVEDPRYRKIHEIGFGLNPASTYRAGINFLPNEMVSGAHFGLGLTPFTEFHIDLVSPGMQVTANTRKGRVAVLESSIPDMPIDRIRVRGSCASSQMRSVTRSSELIA
jgi:hypothetical protein